jgi:hypothetical protein
VLRYLLLGKLVSNAEDTRLSDETLTEKRQPVQGKKGLTHSIPDLVFFQTVRDRRVVD